MARVWTVVGMGVAVGLSLTPAEAGAQAPVPMEPTGTANQAQTRPARVHNALQMAMDAYRRGDYEMAGTYLQQAQAGQDDLTAAERQDLGNWLQLNSSALKARREGANQLRQADQALRQGRTQDALAFLRAVTPNQQFLSSADKQRFQQLSEQMMPSNTGIQQTGTAANSITLARSKLKQARALMRRGDYNAAQALAHEAERLNAVYVDGEDTPSKVYDDISKARLASHRPTDPKGLLTAARDALNRHDLDEAERLAHDAEHAGATSNFVTRLWSDTPAKILKEVQAERARTGQHTAAKPAESYVAKKETPAAGTDRTEAARQMLKDARQALQAGNTAQAKQLTEKARALRPDLGWWEDTPDKVMAEIRQVEGSKGGSKDSVATESTATDPHVLMKQAHELYSAGKLDEAEKLAKKADGKYTTWGLFETSPDRLLADIHKARAKKMQEESVQVLAEARRMYEQGNLREAEKMAHKAEHLHGPYSFLDLGDRPAKLLAEIDTAKVKQAQSKLPPPPAVAKSTPESIPSASSTPAPSWPTKPSTPAVASNTGTMPAAPVPAVGFGGDKKVRAQVLMSEVRQMQKEGRLLEARQKALEAQSLQVTYGPDEDRPESALLALGAICQKRIDGLVQQANDYAVNAPVDASACQRAQATLTQARQLAVGFGFDTAAIDSKLQRIHQLSERGGSAPTVVAQAQHQEPATPMASQNHGAKLLDQARMELRAGQTVTARRLAEEAFDARYGVQNEAAQILRSIDAEEYNQRLLTASRSYDAGVMAHNRREYAQASTILRSIDPHLLPPEKQARLREMLQSADGNSGSLAQARHQAPAPLQSIPAAAQPTRQAPAEADFAQQVRAMQEIKFQKLRTDGMDAQKEAMRRFQAGETDRALELLQEYQTSLNASGLDAEKIALLRRPVEARAQQLKTLKHQRDFEKLQANEREANATAQSRQFLAEEEKKKQVTDLMQKFQTFYKEGKYKEAEMYAVRARDLDPDNPIPGAAIFQARAQAAQVAYKNVKKNKEEVFNQGLDDAEDTGPSVTSADPLKFDRKVALSNRDRKAIELPNIGTRKTEREREIYRRLDTPISSLDFKDTPLRQILDDLAAANGINIVPDEPALNEAGIQLDRPVTMKLEGVALKSALNLLLHQVHLTYVVKDEVLNVTTESHAHGKLETRIYSVADLVIPVENSSGTIGSNVVNAAMSGVLSGDQSNLRTNGAVPWLGANSLGGAAATTAPANGTSITKESPKQTIEDVLIKLITSTIAPQSWASVGGQGTIDYFPLGLALVVNQTPDIQEQVGELLHALRRLQDQEVAVEIRFITIAESFFERIGLNFNINVRTNNNKYEPQLVSQQFRPFGFINHFTPDRFISGLTPAGTLTQDLNIPIQNNSFNLAIPPFGNYPNSPGADGGLSMGLAFLSDIEVFLFMEASQGDKRTNIMQAPKLTLFNGQTSTLTVLDTQFFVSSVTVVQAGGQVVFAPQNSPFPTGGITLTMNAVISADRRFVRMSLTPTLTNLSNANVPLFPITTFVTPVFEGGAVGQPIPFTQFIQQPAINVVTVRTTVNVPDGGTILMGGLKRLSEGRNEFGPPILSKLPYINRLFKNVGYGREAESLLLMVTPRIIINEEEELRQVPGALPGAGQ